MENSILMLGSHYAAFDDRNGIILPKGFLDSIRVGSMDIYYNPCAGVEFDIPFIRVALFSEADLYIIGQRAYDQERFDIIGTLANLRAVDETGRLDLGDFVDHLGLPDGKVTIRGLGSYFKIFPEGTDSIFFGVKTERFKEHLNSRSNNNPPAQPYQHSQHP
jgi:hypothetical protein